MSVLYVPNGRAREYAPLAINHYSGCSHGCVYCYAKNMAFASPDFHANVSSRKGVLAQLKRDCQRSPGHGEKVLLCFTCDPYQPLNDETRLTGQVIQTLHAHGYNIQTLTKGGSRALQDLPLYTPGDSFASTLTLLSDEHSQKWEPGAALPEDRMYTLEAYHHAGIPTWVSLEPVLNPESSLEIIRQSHVFVSLYKIGRLNHHPLANRTDWRQFALDAIALCESLSQPYYLKDDLSKLLPSRIPGPSERSLADIETSTDVPSAVPIIEQPSLL